MKPVDYPETVRTILAFQSHMRNSGIDPTWDRFKSEGLRRGMELDVNQIKEYERLWRILYQICPNPQRDEHFANYLLVYLAHLKDPSIKPNPSAFSLIPDEADYVHRMVTLYSDVAPSQR